MWKGVMKMKKLEAVLTLLMILVFISSPGLAANKDNSILISMDGKRYTVKEVPVVMDGQAIYSNAPAFIHPTNDYTLVPIRFIAERYGANVDWDQKSKTVAVNPKGKEIKMTINSKDVYINGKKKVLDGETTPKLVTFSNKDSRTMVPLRFISETLGYEVGWDNNKKVPFINTIGSEDTNKDTDKNVNTREITNVSIEKGSTNKPKVKINGTKNLKYSTKTLENPNRLVIDIDDARLSLKDNISFENGVGSINVNSNLISKIDVSQFSTTPDKVRITIHLTEKANFDIVTSDDGKSLILSFVKKVGKIEKEIIDGKEALVIHNEGRPETKVMKFNNPERIVLDLMDSSLEGGNYLEYDYNVGFIKKVRVSQFTPDNLYKPNDRIVRVVLDVKKGINDPNVKIDTYDNKIVIIPETSIWEIINYSTEGNNRLVSINANKETDYDVEYDSYGKTMTISIPSKNIDLKEDYLSIKDGLINDISVKEIGDSTKIIINFRRGIDYTILSKTKDRKITVKIKRDENVKPSDRVIVIDPGHGGKDPGAVQNGVKEKDINLSVSQKLDAGLKTEGYTTIMTRDTDTFIELKDRAKIANDEQVDIFISIHSNSHTNGDIDGIQVLYNTSKKDADSLSLANTIMDELVKGTGAKSKGVIERPRLVVLNQTKMPAVLIELGFISNPQEAQKLNDSAYQDLLVESIIKGIERYFELY